MDKEQGKLDWNKETVLQLIEMWQNYECLYNPKHKFYHNKHARYDALNEMADKLKLFNPAIGANDVKCKMGYLRGQYTREVAKVKERKSGAGADDVYVSSAYWFSEMGFLDDFIKIRKGSCNIVFEQNSSQAEDSWDSQLLDIDVSPVPTAKKRRVENDTPVSSRSVSQEDSVLTAATSALRNIANAKKVVNAKTETFCNYIKAELDVITNVKIQDQLMETMTLALLDAKKQQRIYNNTIENSFSQFDVNI